MAKKLKISSVKRSNQKRNKLTKQGKLKTRRHRPPKKQVQTHTVSRQNTEQDQESDYGDDIMDMVEKDDLSFLKTAISNRSYNVFQKLHLNETDRPNNKRKKKKKNDDGTLEEQYENNVFKMMEERSAKKTRLLLPIKHQSGVLEKRVIEEDEKEDEAENGLQEEENEQPSQINGDTEVDQTSDMEIEIPLSNKAEPTEKEKAVSAIDLLACRREVLRSKRIRIGILASGILENPELKCKNLKPLLDMMGETDPEVYITVRKLSMISLLEIFKDILPSYHILQVNQEGVKLKKQTLQLQNYEATLLSSYKQYLQKLEKISNILKKKKGDTRVINEREIQLAEVAVGCMCDLLTTHPYFNFSTNVANYLVTLLNNKRVSVRQKVADCISQIFKEDKRSELSLTIVRKLNQYIKLKSHGVHVEMLSVLLSLRIKDVNLDQEKEEETKQKKLMSHKQRILALSKRERKKNKKLEQVEKELLETKAEENKQTKQKLLTEITSIVFTIYFRILKQAPNSKVLSVCLEGLAKFAHCINLEFYQDLVAAINHLIDGGTLGLREQLHCVQCVFTILSGQGIALNIDPYRFYVHLYKNLLNIHCGKTHPESEIVVKTLVQVLIHRRKRITNSRLIAFVKRMGIVTLQSQHNTTLGLLGIIKQVMQLAKTADILLDTDATTGDGIYQPELEEPEYCNAHCTALWELAALQRHYHSIIQKLAKNIAWGVPTTGEGSLPSDIAKLSPEELFIEYDPTGVSFKPAVPVPKKTTVQNTLGKFYLKNHEFEEYLNSVNDTELFANGYVDFYKEYNVR